ncbi:unnamed protein product [Urochloa decumbens]|uniref:PGG domain-containing protein n=1 Tax=Urochloa decumbens TaxID=240449 RepID=A0ABC9AZM8_9POAL
MAQEKKAEQPWEYTLRKYLLLMATVVATLTYGAVFNPPGGVWPETDAGHLAGDPIIRDLHNRRYQVFFYCNATAFASSLVAIVLILLVSALQLHDSIEAAMWRLTLLPLRLVMVLDLLSLLGAYAAGTCRDAVTTVYSSLLVCGVVAYLMVQTVLAATSDKHSISSDDDSETLGERPREVLMLLVTFAVSVTYASGLSTPGGFWDGSQAGRAAGDAILQDYHRARLLTFFLCNTTAFVASLVIILLLLDKRLRANVSVRTVELYGCIVVALAGLVAAYVAGSTRDAETTAYVVVLVLFVLGYMLFQVFFALHVVEAIKKSNLCRCIYAAASGCLQAILTILRRCTGQDTQGRAATASREEPMDEARSLVYDVLATLATTVTYQAGLDPPGGVWQDDGDGHLAGDPILQTTNPRRYKAFFYCNSTAFIASLVAIVLVQKGSMLKHRTLKGAMILDLLGLVGAYAAGSNRDVSTSIHVVALAGGVVVYVVIHSFFFTLWRNKRKELVNPHDDDDDDDDGGAVKRRRERQLLFAIVAATVTYQAGLTPPAGFWAGDDEPGHGAGDPVLFSNYPRRYDAFFYSNSLSFMSAIVHIVLLVNPKKLYRPAIRSYALSVCTAVGLLGLIGAYAAGCTQHLRMSIYVFVLAFLVILFIAVLLAVGRMEEQKRRRASSSSTVDAGDFSVVEAGGSGGRGSIATGSDDKKTTDNAGDDEAGKKKDAKSEYLMLLGILMAGVTYQAGLNPPGGTWQSDGEGHTAGDPVLRTNRRFQYLFFFHCNSTSFVASIVVVVLLIPERLKKSSWWLIVTNTTIVLNLLGLLGAHAAGSSRGWETSGWYLVALIIAAMAYVALHGLMRRCGSRTSRA